MRLAPALPLPPFFDASRAAEASYVPDAQAVFLAAEQWRCAHGIRTSARDLSTVHLLLIDEQKDFCFPEGSLYVGGRSGRGAIDDSARIASFIHRNVARITALTCTLDTHFPFQIFFPAFWRLPDGTAPAPHRAITTEDLVAKRIQVNPDVASFVAAGDLSWLEKQVLHYCRELERSGKYTLWLWPPHCLLGSDGHALAGVVQEARLFHSYCRGTRASLESKGMHPLTENYSVFSPEVLTTFDELRQVERNQALLERLLRADKLLVAGQASSHCVRSSVDDLLQVIQARDAKLADKVFLLTDCMSAVTVPDGAGGLAADFTPAAEAALARFEEAGMHLVKSSEPMEAWLCG